MTIGGGIAVAAIWGAVAAITWLMPGPMIVGVAMMGMLATGAVAMAGE